MHAALDLLVRALGAWVPTPLQAPRQLRVIRPLARDLEPCRLPMPVPIPTRRPAPKAMAALAALALLGAAPAARAWHADANVNGQLVDVQIQLDGRTAPIYLRPGAWDRYYFQAFRGRNYSLVLRNHVGERIGVLISVDGLNVVNGERSSLGSHEAMYVLDPYESATIRGWRTSLDQVRRFVFVDEERSYASRTDQANGDMGWIRVLTFREWRPISLRTWGQSKPLVRGAPAPSSDSRSDNASPQPPAAEGKDEVARRSTSEYNYESQEKSGARDASPGTGWGGSRYDPVRRVQFTPEGRSTDHLVLRYEYESGLRALGIFPRHGRLWEREHGELGFAKPPRW